MRDGDGFWLNPANQTAVQVVRHELAMANPAELRRLGVAPEVIDEARRHSSYSREGEQVLRMLGIMSGLVRIRDHGDLVTVQWASDHEAEPAIRSCVRRLLDERQLRRPLVKLGNFRTGEQVVLAWEKFVERTIE